MLGRSKKAPNNPCLYNEPPHIGLPNAESHAMQTARLEAALAHIARCIAAHGDVYLPLFERLEAELSAVKAQESARDRALRLARAA